jgi:hypothetical protein
VAADQKSASKGRMMQCYSYRTQGARLKEGPVPMRYLLLLLSLAVPGHAANQSCLIVKHATTSDQFWVSGANWRYVEGEFPGGMKWKSNITDRNVRQIKQKGGKVVIVPEKYSTTDLEDARKQCAVAQTGTVKQ